MSVGENPVGAVLEHYRTRLDEDAEDFTEALLKLAKAAAKGSAGFNQPSPQDAVALHALGHWRRDASHALKRLKDVPADAPGKGLATRWLKALIAALDLQRQSLSLVDPHAAAAAAGRSKRAIAHYHQLEERLDRELP